MFARLDSEQVWQHPACVPGLWLSGNMAVAQWLPEAVSWQALQHLLTCVQVMQYCQAYCGLHVQAVAAFLSLNIQEFAAVSHFELSLQVRRDCMRPLRLVLLMHGKCWAALQLRALAGSELRCLLLQSHKEQSDSAVHCCCASSQTCLAVPPTAGVLLCGHMTAGNLSLHQE